jgi:general stress protein YciG
MANVQNQDKSTSSRGFASMDKARQRQIASEGGKASGGNFANNRERASEAGRKGGQVSNGGSSAPKR